MSPQALFTPIVVGDLHLQHRVVLAPLTRFRNTVEHVPSPIQVEYYSQRASLPGTLLISEATFLAPQAGGYEYAPGIWNDEQVAAWKKVVDAVHAKGSFIFLQLWHLGRAADPSVLKKEGLDVVSASNIPFEGGATPRPLTIEEIEGYPALYAQAARNFIEKAGGDGVEVHCANGYLLDQFLQTTSNKRTDAYGGSLENRLRFPLAVIDAVTKAVGEKKVGFRLSPFGKFQGMGMPTADIHATFPAFVKAIKAAHPSIAYVHVVEGRAMLGGEDHESKKEEDLEFLNKHWAPTPFIVCGAYTAESALAKAQESSNTLVAFGRPFISNPDLPARIKAGIPFTPYNRSTFYLLGPTKSKGYTDYLTAPELAQKAKA